ncbi:MAG: MaoC family dehydratase N-terminal domain-containing protein [Dehalococcoidia bacterium]|nr:MaoC family dehydratase N-terminal domain-containing protein [Dehalococcoidia bacterium]
MTEEKITSNLGGNPKYTWDDAVAAIGKDFSGGSEQVAEEVIEHASVMRFCEPWEISNPIYWSEQAAKQLGYRGVVAPISSIRYPFSATGKWRPGVETRFPTQEPNASSHSSGYSRGPEEIPIPLHHHSVVTNWEIEFFEPACVGDRLTVRGDKLVNVAPKRTRAGIGAFVTRERRTYNQRGELVVRGRFTSFSYNRE